MLPWTTFVAMYFVNVINIYNQVTLSKTDTLHNMDTPDPISEGLKSKTKFHRGFHAVVLSYGFQTCQTTAM